VIDWRRPTLASQVIAVNFLSPSNGVDWLNSGPNNISWNHEAGAPEFVNIQLLHYGSSTFEPIEGLLTSDGLIATAIHVTIGTMMLMPSCINGNPSLPTGSGYSLRMFSETPNDTQTTLGTSNGTFNIVAAMPTECIGLGNGTLTSSVSVGPTSPASVSTLSPSSPKSHVAAIAGGVVGGILACLLVVAATVMYKRHCRALRKRMTQQFVMKKGLVIGKPAGKDVEMT